MKNEIEEKELFKRTMDIEEDIRGPYFRDQTKIIHSMPFRRLKHKTQVFFSPKNDHVCTRIEHVLHVATIAATICKGINKITGNNNLDQDLAYAIGLGHDLGHAPFGHAGEDALSKWSEQKFMHELNGYRVVEKISNSGNGMNLTYAVKDGIICHNGEKFKELLEPLEPCKEVKDLEKIINRSSLPSTWEGCIVRISDKIAYLGRDLEDSVILGFINEKDIPIKIKRELGEKNGDIINRLILDLISNSNDSLRFSEEVTGLLLDLKDFNYEKIYGHKRLQDYKIFINKMISDICDYLLEFLDTYGFKKQSSESYDQDNILYKFSNYLVKMESFYQKEETSHKQIITDYVSGMTDSFLLEAVNNMTFPTPI